MEIICRTKNSGSFYVSPTDFIENRLCFFGIWEPTITKLFEQVLSPGDVVIDVGANIGYYSVLASKLVGPKGQVFAVEASSTIRQRLERNLKLNESENIEVIPCGAWHEAGKAELHLIEGNRGSSTISGLETTRDSEEIQLQALDSLIPTDVRGRVKLIKIDVEGAEESALRGAESILRSSPPPTVLCEVTPDRLESLKGSVEHLFDFMSNLGYEPFQIDNDYSFESYIAPASSIELLPITEVPLSPCDIVFSIRV